jgi:hypothetical protein
MGLVSPLDIGPGGRHDTAEGGRPGRPRRRQAAGSHAQGRHHLLHGLRERRIGRQRRHLILPEVDVAARQILQIRGFRVLLRLLRLVVRHGVVLARWHTRFRAGGSALAPARAGAAGV